ncbi:MAG: right-handed parallel beta-helix repeat-containing protein [Ruminococcaceae bacterium]|nr:right-handed parallel beta-helix repeat-containing protein [Oscillospiraceae bacterium]
MSEKKVISTLENGILPNILEDSSQKFIELLTKNKENATFVISAGSYYLKSRIEIENLKNIDIIGYGVRFITDFNPAVNYSSSGGFRFDNCDDIKVCGITFKTKKPGNISGTVTAINLENNTFDVKVEDNFDFSGNERILGLDSLSINGTPDFRMGLSDSNSYKYELLSEKSIRISLWHTVAYTLKNIAVGDKLCLRYALYFKPPFVFTACNRVLLEDITIESTAGHCCGVYPRSSDFTFRRFNVRQGFGSLSPYSSCSDGIHIKGLTGKLFMEDCHFYNMGDDSLNIHNKAGTVFDVQNGILKIGIKSPQNSLEEVPKELLPDDWAEKGDLVYMYDENTLQRMGSFKIESFGSRDGYNFAEISELCGEITKGVKLANSAYNAKVYINNCSVNGSRARGFLLQTENVTVENCRFSQTASAALMLCCDVSRWNELGPTRNAVIKNNVFDNCGVSVNSIRASGIVIGVNHANSCAERVERMGVHENILIENNRFINIKDSAIFADAVKGINIQNNTLINCCFDIQNRPDDYKAQVVLFNCNDVKADDNIDLTNEKVSFINC